MVAKMIVFAAAVSLSGLVATASAAVLPPVFAEADQVTRAYSDENYSEGETEADSEGALNEAYADAEGFAGYTEGETAFPPISYTGNFAAAKTVAETTGVDSDTESVADSDARSDGAAAAEALAESESPTTGDGAGDARADAFGFALGGGFAGAETLAEAYGADDAVAFAFAQGAADDGDTLADADAEAAGGDDAYSRAVSRSTSDTANPDDFSLAVADAYSVSGLTGTGESTADSSADATAINAADAQARATSFSLSEAAVPFGSAGTATSRATSRASGEAVAP